MISYLTMLAVNIQSMDKSVGFVFKQNTFFKWPIINDFCVILPAGLAVAVSTVSVMDLLGLDGRRFAAWTNFYDFLNVKALCQKLFCVL